MAEFDPFASDYSTENADKETIHEGGGGGVQLDGRYHVIVEKSEYLAASVEGDDEDADDYARSLPMVKVQMSVLGGEHESEKGKKIFHRVFLGSWKDDSGNDTKKAGRINPLGEKQLHGTLAFLHAFGVIGDDAFGQSTFKLSLDMFERLENTQAIVRVSMSEERTNAKTGQVYKPSAQMWNNDAWPLGHEKVSDVPRDHEAANYVTSGEVSSDDLDDI